MTTYDVTTGYRVGRTACKRFDSVLEMVRFIEEYDIMNFTIKDRVLVYRLNKEQANEVRTIDTQQKDEEV